MLEGQLIRPVWAEVDLDCIAHNICEVKRLVGKKVQVMAIIKADGYGHGALHIAEVLLKNGASQFGVATLSEALVLKKRFPNVPVLVLGYTPDECLHITVQYGIMQTIFTYEQAKRLSAEAMRLNKEAEIHIKVDTGMRRLGFQVNEESFNAIKEISKMDYLNIKGIYTHFAKADERDKTFTHNQMKRYFEMVDQLEQRGVDVGIKHVANSAGIIDLPEYHLDMVRAGIMLYGLYPSDDVQKNHVDLHEAMQLKARIAHIKEIAAGDGVSYGQRFIASENRTIATLPLGYADGFTRLLSFKAMVLINGSKCPVVGTICMDQCMVDVTGIDVKSGDEVVLFGKSNGETHSIDAVAKLLGTINYEIVCMMGKRIPRVYKENQKITNIEDFNITHDFL